ncbi:MAG: hypothetical protein M5R40_04225 [Anaerolineae bacterium]|nr:hypothetical protein [Anaerolineae bacterium]
MIFGPSDPRRYGPYAPPARVRHVWREIGAIGGVNVGPPPDFDWEREGVDIEEAWGAVTNLLSAS